MSYGWSSEILWPKCSEHQVPVWVHSKDEFDSRHSLFSLASSSNCFFFFFCCYILVQAGFQLIACRAFLKNKCTRREEITNTNDLTRFLALFIAKNLALYFGYWNIDVLFFFSLDLCNCKIVNLYFYSILVGSFVFNSQRFVICQIVFWKINVKLEDFDITVE